MRSPNSASGWGLRLDVKETRIAGVLAGRLEELVHAAHARRGFRHQFLEFLVQRDVVRCPIHDFVQVVQGLVQKEIKSQVEGVLPGPVEFLRPCRCHRTPLKSVSRHGFVL
jgi:hypothetical protein